MRLRGPPAEQGRATTRCDAAARTLTRSQDGSGESSVDPAKSHLATLLTECLCDRSELRWRTMDDRPAHATTYDSGEFNETTAPAGDHALPTTETNSTHGVGAQSWPNAAANC